jgi:hypothetical protein
VLLSQLVALPEVKQGAGGLLMDQLVAGEGGGGGHDGGRQEELSED